MGLPFFTSELAGIGGRIKRRAEDFRVDEAPLYQPCGEGTHVYFRVRKVGIPTPAVVERIAEYMHVRRTDIGFAGMKDAQAVTTQWMSLEHADPDKLAAYRDKQVAIEQVARHANKLRAGHLAGNRFAIRIRQVGPDALPAARAVLDVLGRRGAPNYFGSQRFGLRGDTGALGEALIRNDLEEFVAIYLGRPAADPPDCRMAREAFDAGDLARARTHWPRHYANERRALAAYKKRRCARAAVAAIDKRMKRFYVSAFQSEVFNEVLAARIGSIDRVMTGDWARKTDTGGVFLVEDADAAQPRAEAFEISATGPIVGYRASLAEGEPGQIERRVLAGRGVTREQFRTIGPLKAKGSRRPLRFSLAQPGISAGSDEHGEYIELTFTASSGCYATAVLREIMKTD